MEPNNGSFIDPNPESAVLLGIVYAIYAAVGIPGNLLVLILTLAKPTVRAVPAAANAVQVVIE